eukprot:scaffold43210_cov63-Phaeocystis_antarctica.AAC.2
MHAIVGLLPLAHVVPPRVHVLRGRGLPSRTRPRLPPGTPRPRVLSARVALDQRARVGFREPLKPLRGVRVLLVQVRVSLLGCAHTQHKSVASKTLGRGGAHVPSNRYAALTSSLDALDGSPSFSNGQLICPRAAPARRLERRCRASASSTSFPTPLRRAKSARRASMGDLKVREIWPGGGHPQFATATFGHKPEQPCASGCSSCSAASWRAMHSFGAARSCPDLGASSTVAALAHGHGRYRRR